MAPDNVEKLKAAGLVDAAYKHPEQFSDFLAGLTEEQVDALVAIKARLDEAEVPVETLKPPYKAMPIF